MIDLISLSAVYLMIFFLGIRVLQTGLQQLAFSKMQKVLSSLTQHPYAGIVTGIIATAILQSSSLVLVLTISLAGAGLLSFKQSIGVVLGANIGTTMTAEIMTLSAFVPDWLFVVIGAVLLLTSNRQLFSIGAVLFGIGSVFIALHGFETLAPLVVRLPILTDAIVLMEDWPETGVLVGTIVSGIIQSSSATIGIVMSFLKEGILSLESSIAITLGANIGTCVTAVLASIKGEQNMKLIAKTHVWFNLFSVLLFLPFLAGMTELAAMLAAESDRQLAHISVLFNIVSVLLLLPFLSAFEKFILYQHRRAS